MKIEDTRVETIDIGGVALSCTDEDGAIAEAVRLYERDEPGFIAYANVYGVNLAQRDETYLGALRAADLVLNDGKGVMLGARLLGKRFPVDLNGNHFTPLLLSIAAERRWPVYFFGARPGVAQRAAAALRAAMPALEVAGIRDGDLSRGTRDEIVGDIRDAGSGLLLAALGNPLQEKWLAANLADTGARLGVGVGAFFDFQAGEVRRAPAWMNRAGLEWIHRLGLEPRRMWRRYLIGNPMFVWRVLRQRLSERRPGQ